MSAAANRELVDNSEAEEDKVTCDECATLISEDTYGANDGLCDTCHAAVHFVCGQCTEVFHTDDQSEEFPKLCIECGYSKHAEIVEELADAVSAIIGGWDGEETEIAKLRKLLAYARRLK